MHRIGLQEDRYNASTGTFFKKQMDRRVFLQKVTGVQSLAFMHTYFLLAYRTGFLFLHSANMLSYVSHSFTDPSSDLRTEVFRRNMLVLMLSLSLILSRSCKSQDVRDGMLERLSSKIFPLILPRKSSVSKKTVGID